MYKKVELNDNEVLQNGIIIGQVIKKIDEGFVVRAKFSLPMQQLFPKKCCLHLVLYFCFYYFIIYFSFRQLGY